MTYIPDPTAFLGPPAPGQTGQYFYPISGQGTGTSAALGNSSLRAAPWVVYRTVHITRLGGEVTVIGDVGSKLRLGIWEDSSGYPGDLVIDAGTINGDSATVQEVTVNVTLLPGVYWIGGAVQIAPSTQPTVRTLGATTTPHLFALPVGASLPSANGTVVALSVSGVAGAFAATFPAGGAAVTAAPRLLAKVA